MSVDYHLSETYLKDLVEVKKKYQILCYELSIPITLHMDSTEIDYYQNSIDHLNSMKLVVKTRKEYQSELLDDYKKEIEKVLKNKRISLKPATKEQKFISEEEEQLKQLALKDAEIQELQVAIENKKQMDAIFKAEANAEPKTVQDNTVEEPLAEQEYIIVKDDEGFTRKKS
ncbi:MAG: hypothetical protein IMZ52_09540 [Actinobacteria bacterium]|nr:hypothetical protein [Actinomycetota bacterium]